jgi:hypothetical protein
MVRSESVGWMVHGPRSWALPLSDAKRSSLGGSVDVGRAPGPMEGGYFEGGGADEVMAQSCHSAAVRVVSRGTGYHRSRHTILSLSSEETWLLGAVMER